ncbi:unnamed protein product [Bursaphelenchus xylophilus]|uniref:(pine wood nematode) hypothetical protein n=1 Tax=Bursaphelenchus xylophilus TaxID=6326 RepID=A0A1I7RV62_BURXY|nr:unnamed protein product [Bursaphelenchus xylophilus]CAG9124647.1 unnamed protein product [Bursaphelenchus xylophilus]
MVKNLSLEDCKAYKGGYLIGSYETDIKENTWNIKFGIRFARLEYLTLEFKYNGAIGNEFGFNVKEYYVDGVNNFYLTTSTSNQQRMTSLLPVFKFDQEFLLTVNVDANGTVISNGRSISKGSLTSTDNDEIKLNRLEDIIIIIGPFLHQQHTTRYDNMIVDYVQPELQYDGDRTGEFFEQIWTVIQNLFGKDENDIAIVRLLDLSSPTWNGNILSLPYNTSLLTSFVSSKEKVQMKMDITTTLLRRYFGQNLRAFDQKTDNLFIGISRYLAAKLLEDTMDNVDDQLFLNEITIKNQNDAGDKAKDMMYTLERMFGKEVTVNASVQLYDEYNGKMVSSERFGYAFETVIKSRPICGRLAAFEMINSWVQKIDVETTVTVDKNYKLKQSPVRYIEQKILPVFYMDDDKKEKFFYLQKSDIICFPNIPIDLNSKIIFSPHPQLYNTLYHQDVLDFYQSYGLDKWTDEMAYNLLLTYQSDYKEPGFGSMLANVIKTRNNSKTSLNLLELFSEFRERKMFNADFNNVYRNFIYGHTQRLNEDVKGSSLRKRYLQSLVSIEAVRVGITEEKERYVKKNDAYQVHWAKNGIELLESLNPDDFTAMVCASVSNLNFVQHLNWTRVISELSKLRPSVIYEPLFRLIEKGLQCLTVA